MPNAPRSGVAFIPKNQLKGNNAMPSEVDVTTQFFSKYTPEQIRAVFGKGSSSLVAHQLFRRDQKSYEEMKIVAVYRDRVLGEDSLPLKQRLTKDQLEQKYKADRAAAEDNLFTLPPALADRLGLDRNTRVTYEQLAATLGKQSA
jgi:hypothetical protein